MRQRALEDGKTVYMAVPRLAEPEPFFADLTEEKIAAIPLLSALRTGRG
ncbi:MAG TPA: hypothetical protein VG164_05230 [Trebonia sp.]|nr:hypothetical protein [Trebonia sp.]